MIRILSILILPLLLLQSCRKPLCYEHYHPHGRQIRVIIDYTYMDYIPAQMRVDFYTESGEHTVRYVTQTNNIVDLPVGKYKTMTFNDNSEYFSLEDEIHFEGIHARLPFITRSMYNSIYLGCLVPYSTKPGIVQGGVLSPVHTTVVPQAGTIGQPDLLFTDACPLFEVTEDPALQTDLYFTPRNVSVAYHISVKATGLEYTEQARGTMSGVSYTKYLHNRTRELDPAVAMFDCVRGTGIVTTTVTAFGLVRSAAGDPALSGMNKICFEFLLRDGSTYSCSFDIRAILTDGLCANGGVIDLTGYTIDIPKVESGGFEVELEDWYDEQIIHL